MGNEVQQIKDFDDTKHYDNFSNTDSVMTQNKYIHDQESMLQAKQGLKIAIENIHQASQNNEDVAIIRHMLDSAQQLANQICCEQLTGMEAASASSEVGC